MGGSMLKKTKNFLVHILNYIESPELEEVTDENDVQFVTFEQPYHR